MSDNTHAAMCVYCGETIIYDTREVTDITDAHAQIVEHDQQCSKNPLVEDLARHKRMFAAACETLGEIQQALGNSVVGIEPTLVKELVEERDALAAHVKRISACRLESGRIGIWSLNNALKETPTISLNRHDAKTLRKYADMLEAEETPDAEAGDMWDASQCAEWMREQADKAEGHQ